MGLTGGSRQEEIPKDTAEIGPTNLVNSKGRGSITNLKFSAKPTREECIVTDRNREVKRRAFQKCIIDQDFFGSNQLSNLIIESIWSSSDSRKS